MTKDNNDIARGFYFGGLTGILGGLGILSAGLLGGLGVLLLGYGLLNYSRKRIQDDDEK